MFHRIKTKVAFRNIISSPLLHFCILGSIFFGIQKTSIGTWLSSGDEEISYEISFSKNQFERFAQRPWDSSLDLNEIKQLLNSEIEEEILFRQALRLRLDKNHPGIRRRLEQLGQYLGNDPTQSAEDFYRQARDMGLIHSDPVVRRQLVAAMKQLVSQMPLPGEKKIGSADLQNYLSTHGQEFNVGHRFDFTHLFIRGRKNQSRQQITELREKVRRASLSPQATKDLGHPFLHGHEFSQLDRNGATKLFGESFAQALSTMSVGEWSEVIPSSYGWHLVYLQEKTSVKPLEIAPLKNQIYHAVMRSRQQNRLQTRLNQLKKQYSVSISQGGPLP